MLSHPFLNELIYGKRLGICEDETLETLRIWQERSQSALSLHRQVVKKRRGFLEGTFWRPLCSVQTQSNKSTNVVLHTRVHSVHALRTALGDEAKYRLNGYSDIRYQCIV